MLLLTAAYIYFRCAKLALLQRIWLALGYLPAPVLRLFLLTRRLKGGDSDCITLFNEDMDQVRVRVLEVRLFARHRSRDITAPFIWRYKYRALYFDDLTRWCARISGQRVYSLTIRAAARGRECCVRIDLENATICFDSGAPRGVLFNTLLWPLEEQN